MTTDLALSVRQPYADLIVDGVKTFEFRSRRTHTRGRVLIYSARTRVEAGAEGRLTGLILGSVVIVDCEWHDDVEAWAWALRRPRRFAVPLVACGMPMPMFWKPTALRIARSTEDEGRPTK